MSSSGLNQRILRLVGRYVQKTRPQTFLASKKKTKRGRKPSQQVGSFPSVVTASRSARKTLCSTFTAEPTRGGLKRGEQTAAAKFKHHQRNVSGSQRSFCGGLVSLCTSQSHRARLPLTFLHGGGGGGSGGGSGRLPHQIFSS